MTKHIQPKHWIAVLGITGVLTGCAEPAAQPMPAGSIIVFHDRTDAKYEWVIIMTGGKMFIQHAAFPGYMDRSWYLVDEDHLGDRCCTVGGDLKPPLVPDGPNLIRETISDKGVTLKTDYFSDKAANVRNFLGSLEAMALKEKPAATLPDWVKENKTLVNYLGI